MNQQSSPRLSLSIKILSATVIFFIILVIHSYSPITTMTDSGWFIHTAMSFLESGNGNLDEYGDLIRPYYYPGFQYAPDGCQVYSTKQNPDYQIKCIHGSLYDDYPIGGPISIIPYLLVVDWLSPYLLDIDNLAEYLLENRPDEMVQFIQKLIASAMVATTGVVLFFISLRFLSLSRAFILIFIFAFCTPAWTTASRTVWQHTPTILIFTVVIYLIFLSKDRPYLIQFIALPLAFSYVVRPTNAISIAVFTIFVLIQHPRQFIRYCLWAATIAIPFFAYNLNVYEALRSPYYAQPLGNASFIDGAMGVLFSPSRGLFIYSSIFLFSFYGIMLRLKSREWLSLDLCLTSIVVLHWLVISHAFHWWGGSSIGPRFFTDMVPYLTYFLIPVVAQLSLSRKFFSLLLNALFFTLTLISFAIQAHCVTAKGPWEWNGIPQGDITIARLWDWSDPQFLRGLGLKSAQMALTPSMIYITHAHNDSDEVVIDITLSNPSEHEFIWEERAPFSIKEAWADVETTLFVDSYGYTVLSGTAHRFTTQTITIRADMAPYESGIHNLGGLEIVGYLDSDTLVGNSPTIIPITLEIPKIWSSISPALAKTKSDKKYQVYLPLISATNTNKVSQNFSPPSDILVNDLPQSTSLRIVHGLGWYPMVSESRLAQLPATIYIESPIEQTVHIEAILTTNVASENLTIYANQSKTSLDSNKLVTTDIVLKKGWNILTFEEANNIPVSISVAFINIITETSP